MAGESLKVVAGNAAGSSIALEQELVIGRSTPGLGSLGGDSEISRVHARIYHDASGQVIVEDLGSTNGTFVNGSRIAAATVVRAGDQVRVGQTTMTVEGGAGEGATTVGQVIPAAAPPPPAAAAPPPPAAVAATPPTQQFQPAQPPGGQFGGPQQPGYAGGPVGGPPGAQSGGSRAPWIALAAAVLIALIVAGLAIGGVFSSDKKNVVTTTPVATTPAAPPATTPPPATTTPTSTPPSMTGPAGTMGPPPGPRYDVHNRTVLNHIQAALKRYLKTKGVPNAQVVCVALSSSKAGCKVVNPANGKSVIVAVKVNQTTGALRVV
jgi:predicted component of type VI protein secretion system